MASGVQSLSRNCSDVGLVSPFAGAVVVSQSCARRPHCRAHSRRRAFRALAGALTSPSRASFMSTAASGARVTQRADARDALRLAPFWLLGGLTALWLGRRLGGRKSRRSLRTRYDFPDREPDDRLRPHRQSRPQGPFAPTAARCMCASSAAKWSSAPGTRSTAPAGRIAPSPPARRRPASGCWPRPCSRRRPGACWRLPRRSSTASRPARCASPSAATFSRTCCSAASSRRSSSSRYGAYVPARAVLSAASERPGSRSGKLQTWPRQIIAAGTCGGAGRPPGTPSGHSERSSGQTTSVGSGARRATARQRDETRASPSVPSTTTHPPRVQKIPGAQQQRRLCEFARIAARERRQSAAPPPRASSPRPSDDRGGQTPLPSARRRTASRRRGRCAPAPQARRRRRRRSDKGRRPRPPKRASAARASCSASCK